MDAFELSDNFQRFVRSLDYPVAFYEYMYSIIMIDNPKETLLFLMLATVAIIYYEYISTMFQSSFTIGFSYVHCL